MNNPFSRLKHYLPDKIDPQENHATECLAACLVFGPTIRSEFVRFLSRDIEVKSADGIDVVTQEPISGGGYVDVVLTQQQGFVIAVEVKVRSPENCDHHRQQLRKYREWLSSIGDQQSRFLFTLVRNKDETFQPEQYGANGRYTWQEMHHHFKRLLKKESMPEMEASLIGYFCDYLESEGIVTTYKLKDLPSYAAGLTARKAVVGIFNELSAQLRNLDQKFRTRSTEGKLDYWPELKIQHPDWENIFGKGDNWKISLWFAVPGIWDRRDEERHGYLIEIVLYSDDHGNNWDYIRSKLPEWEKFLKSNGFDWFVWRNWNNKQATPAEKIEFQPKKIACFKASYELTADKFPDSEEDLISKLLDWVKQHAEIINSLATESFRS